MQLKHHLFRPFYVFMCVCVCVHGFFFCCPYRCRLLLPRFFVYGYNVLLLFSYASITFVDRCVLMHSAHTQMMISHGSAFFYDHSPVHALCCVIFVLCCIVQNDHSVHYSIFINGITVCFWNMLASFAISKLPFSCILCAVIRPNIK